MCQKSGDANEVRIDNDIIDSRLLSFSFAPISQICLQLKEKIDKLEKANLAKKPWQMSGETGGNVRPVNSLLEEDVSFDHTTTAGKKNYVYT